jgi:hypothetical protein
MPHTDRRDYYVTMVRAKRTAYLAGPFAAHTEALALVEPARHMACDLDQWAWFDLFGTASRPYDAANPIGKLNERLGVIHRAPGENNSL